MSNVVELREWRNKPVGEQPRQRFYASTQETLALLQAFTAIESPLVRRQIIRAVRNALLSNANRPPMNTA